MTTGANVSKYQIKNGMDNEPANKLTFSQLLVRACRLRCPVCGQGKLFQGLFAMHLSCNVCKTVYQREPGFFLGAIYFNYGLTAMVVAVAYPILLFNGLVSRGTLMASTFGFVIVFPIWFFRYARSLWLGFDQYWDPRESELQKPDSNHGTGTKAAP